MGWRRKAPVEPDVEWAMSVQELEPSDEPAEATLAPPPPPPASAQVRRTPRVDLQRAVLMMCAVVATLALVVTALMQRDLRDFSRRESCFLEAQYRAFADPESDNDPADLRDALAECGVEFSEADEG
jgi:hypothetical protein